MTTIVSRLDLTQIFYDVDDFYQHFERNYHASKKLFSNDQQKLCQSRLYVSEVMTALSRWRIHFATQHLTIAITFPGSGYRTFKEFYLKEVLQHWHSEFPNLVSYTRFVDGAFKVANAIRHTAP